MPKMRKCRTTRERDKVDSQLNHSVYSVYSVYRMVPRDRKPVRTRAVRLESEQQDESIQNGRASGNCCRSNAVAACGRRQNDFHRPFYKKEEKKTDRGKKKKKRVKHNTRRSSRYGKPCVASVEA